MLCIFFVTAIIADDALGHSLTSRYKRQSPRDDDNSLEDRYGWNRPQGSQGGPWNQARPNQGTDMNQRPNQGQNNWQGPNQGGAPWMQPNQGQDQWDQRPGNQDQWSDLGRPNQNPPQPTTPGVIGGTTTQSAALRDCIRNCPVTSEYNPVCGSNRQTYRNPGSLTCAQTCGVNVQQQRSSPCPTTTTAAPSS